MLKFIENWKTHSYKRKCERVEQQATELYQIREYNEELWLTFGGALICPCDMLVGDDSVATLKEIRENYIRRHLSNL